MKLGFIGLGNMGRPMCTSLVTKGMSVTAYDVVKTSTQILEQRGAKAAGGAVTKAAKKVGLPTGTTSGPTSGPASAPAPSHAR